MDKFRFFLPHQLDAQYDRGAPTYEPLNYCRAKSEQDIQTDATVENCRILLYLHTIYHKIRIVISQKHPPQNMQADLPLPKLVPASVQSFQKSWTIWL